MRNFLDVTRPSRARQSAGNRRPQTRQAGRLGAAFVAIVLATVYARFFERSGPTINVIWMANGLLLTYLLLAPRWRWRGYLITGMAAMVVGSVMIGETWKFNLLYNSLNLVEVLTGALLLRRKSTDLPRFTDRRYLVRFVGYAVLAGPIAAGTILTVVMVAWRHDAALKTLLDWVIGDGIGAAVMVPTFAAIFATRFRDAGSLKKHWAYLAVLGVVSLAAFSQSRMPLLVLVIPLLVLVLIRMGLGWAALATLFVAAAASYFTIHGMGPFAISASLPVVEASIRLQFFVACCLFTIYVVSVILEERNATEYRLQEIAAMHSLVTDYSRDVILLADLDGRRTFVSPAAEAINGWKPEELIHEKLSDLAHPEDRERIDDAVQRIRHGSEGITIEYRVRKRDGEHVWVESSLRMYRDRRTQVPAGILCIVRDISERKRGESLLFEAYRALEELAVQDPLTGVANRRRFDECLANEWTRSARLQKPISLLLIDADFFKEHNDAYGHLSGDRCLKLIADAARAAAMRPEDLVARLGGDEFAVVLPDTDDRGAEEVGRKIRAIISALNPPENGHPEDLVTVSVGCATAIPKAGASSDALIQIADEALYKAKRSGRNQICTSFDRDSR